MIDRVVHVVAGQVDESAVLVSDERRSCLDIRANDMLNRAGLHVVDDTGAKLAFPFDHPEHDCLTSAALGAALTLRSVLVLLPTADVGFVGLQRALEGRVERLRAGRMPQAMQDEPRGLLRDVQVLGQLRAGDTFLVARDQPDRHEPLAQREFRVRKNGADLDREPAFAVAALVRLPIREMIDASAAAVGAELAIAPADCPQVVDASLLVLGGFHHFEEAVELLDHGSLHRCTRNLGIYVT